MKSQDQPPESGELELRIHAFKWGTMPKNATIGVVAKRRAGKSTCMISILHHFRKSFRQGLIFSESEDSNQAYSAIFPPLFIYDELDFDVIARFICQQKRLIRKYGQSDPRTFSFIVFDDCMFDAKRITKHKLMRYLFMNGRQINIMVIMSAQFIVDLPGPLRANFDYIFSLQENNGDIKEKLHRYFFKGVLHEYRTFATVHDHCTDNYGCLVLDNASPRNGVQNKLFWYRAPVGLKFKLGGQELWDFARQHQMSASELEAKAELDIQSLSSDDGKSKSKSKSGTGASTKVSLTDAARKRVGIIVKKIQAKSASAS